MNATKAARYQQAIAKFQGLAGPLPDDAKVVDLFAGAGGFTTGATMAKCRVVWAANHWPAAVEAHAANHPGTTHACQDLHQADWRSVPAHDLLLASPACQGHTNARGKDRPHHDATRSTAWAVVSALEYHRTPYAIVENVPEFLKWALYPAWEIALQALGYTISPYIIDAADHGVPQNRVRLFLVLSRSVKPVELKLPKREHVPIASIIDWWGGNWGPVCTPNRAASTLERVRVGRERYGDKFLIAYYGNGSGLTGRSLDRPIGTLTTHDRYALVDGDQMRLLTVAEQTAAMGFPEGYQLPAKREDAVFMLGNAVCPQVAADLIDALKAA